MKFFHDLFIQRKHSVYLFREAEGLNILKAPEPEHVVHFSYDETKQFSVDSEVNKNR